MKERKKTLTQKSLIDDIHTDFPYYGYRFSSRRVKEKRAQRKYKKDSPVTKEIWAFPCSFKEGL